jgi:hypothetical protein
MVILHVEYRGDKGDYILTVCYVMLMLIKQTEFMKRKKILVPDRTLGRLTFANWSKLFAILHLHISLPALANYRTG